jgi:hypothetical protein
MLIVYDFEGGAGSPTITMRRWVTAGACEVGSAPCWGPSTNLTALGFAEARVNTFGAVTDALAPGGVENVGTIEFGEAGINLTAAGVFGANTCAAFGHMYAVSRTSGNSANAQMKDLVGPGKVNIANCGKVIIRKATDPSPDPTDSSFGFTSTGGLVPAAFSLKDGQSRDYGSNVFSGNYTVTETDPGALNFQLSDVDCTASSTTNGSTYAVNGATVSFNMQPNDIIDCTFTNKLQLGALEVIKTRKHAAAGPGDHPHAGVLFTLRDAANQVVDSGVTDANGRVCFEDLAFGNYTVTETVPAGYVPDGDTTKPATVSGSAACADDPFGGASVSFANTPLTDIYASASSQIAGGTHTQITCVDEANVQIASTANVGNPVVDVKNLPPGTYTCTFVVDP